MRVYVRVCARACVCVHVYTWVQLCIALSTLWAYVHTRLFITSIKMCARDTYIMTLCLTDVKHRALVTKGLPGKIRSCLPYSVPIQYTVSNKNSIIILNSHHYNNF